MVEQNHYRWDFIGLSTDTKPTPADSEKVTDGSTYYTSDDSKLYVWYKDQWYEKEVEGGGGGGTSYTAGDGIDITNHTISVDTDTIQEKLTAGTNITIDNNVISSTGGEGDTVYSTKTTSNSSNGGAVYIGNLDSNQQEQADPTTTDNHYRYFHALPYDNPTSTGAPKNGSINILGECRGDGSVVLGLSAFDGQSSYYQIAIGQGAHTTANSAVGIGYGTSISAENSVAIGRSASVDVSQNQNSVALGAYSKATRKGEVNIGTNGNNLGYNNTDYRLIGGVHDPVDAHDAATKGYVDSHAGGSGFTTLTTEDYNWNSSTGQTGTPNCVALWLLPSGIYKGPADSSIDVRATRSQDYSMGSGFPSYAIVKEYEGNSNRAIVTYFDGSNSSIVEYYSIAEDGTGFSTKNFPNVVQSTGTSTTNVMSQKAVTDALSALETRIAALEGA